MKKIFVKADIKFEVKFDCLQLLYFLTFRTLQFYIF